MENISKQQIKEYGKKLDYIVLAFKKDVEDLINGFTGEELKLYGEDYASDEFIRKILKLYLNSPSRIIPYTFPFRDLSEEGAYKRVAGKCQNVIYFLEKIKGLEGFEPPKEVRQWLSDHGSKKENNHEKIL